MVKILYAIYDVRQVNVPPELNRCGIFKYNTQSGRPSVETHTYEMCGVHGGNSCMQINCDMT